MNEKFSCGASHQSKGKCLAKIASSVVLAGAFVLAAPQMAFAAGGASGAKVVSVPAIGKIGSIIVNPYGIAPLTAIIENGGYVLRNAKVTVAGKSGGVTIKSLILSLKPIEEFLFLGFMQTTKTKSAWSMIGFLAARSKKSKKNTPLTPRPFTAK